MTPTVKPLPGGATVQVGQDPIEGIETYHFSKISTVNTIRGDVPSNALVYCGDKSSKWYPREADISEVPSSVIQALEERGYTVITGIDAGWAEWDGRPEWSETYADVSDAERVTF